MSRYNLLFLLLLLFASYANSQPYFPLEGQVYRTDIIPRVDISISEDTLQWIYNNVLSENEFKALFVYTAGGISDTLSDIGFRLRGNTSRFSTKKSFKISFNTFSPERKYNGLEKMNLNGEHNDPSIIRSRLTWDLFRQMQVVGSRSNHVNVFINGRYYGLYINVEHVDEQFVESRFGNKLGNLYKCIYPADLTYLGTDKNSYKSNGYTLLNNPEQDNFSDLISFVNKLNSTSSENLPADIEPVFNINNFLRYLAVEAFSGHWDGYSYNRNNFYLFNNLYTGKFEFMPYDVDNTFGIDWFGIDWANRNIYAWWNNSEARPLTSKILGNQVYKDRFSFFLNELITRYADTAKIFPEIDAIQAKISSSAQADGYRPLDYGWSFENFNQSYSQALGAHVKYGLKPYITARIASIKQQLVLNPISPIIENVYHSLPQTSKPILITLNISDDQDAPSGKLFYKINDGALMELALVRNPENKFVAQIPALLSAGNVKYYIEATDVSSNTTREPSFGDYSLNVGVSTPSVIINEFMAGNNSAIADNYGQKEDWIEIKNVGSNDVNMDGKYLTDDLFNPAKFKLPATTLGPGKYMLIWADGDTGQGSNHANFKLSNGGESIGIFDSYDMDFAPLNILDYPAQQKDFSSGVNLAGDIVQQAFITPMGDNNSNEVAFITFRFRMGQQIELGNFHPASDFIDVAGTFNGWTGGAPVFDANGDGIYQYTEFGFTSGETIQYKARMNANWGTAEFPELGGSGNRFYTLLPGHNILEHIYNQEGFYTSAINSEKNNFSLYPNPTKYGDFNVKASFIVKGISVYSISGSLIYESVDLNTGVMYVPVKLSKGIYVVKISGTNRDYLTRLVVN